MLFLGLAAVHADSTMVEGYIANAGGKAISVDIVLTPLGQSPITTTITCDNDGYFFEMFDNTGSTGDAEVSITDCNSTVVKKTQSYSPNNQSWVSFKLDYCPSTSANCEAKFVITNVKDNSGNPIPGQLVIYEHSAGIHLSSFTWDFGDGTTSNLRTPTHSYAGNGPYQICLMVGDSLGCKDTLCDSIAVDTAGLYVKKKAGFSLTVVNADEPTSIGKVVNEIEAGLFPNPVINNATVAFRATESTQVTLEVYNLAGAVVQRIQNNVGAGEHQMQLNMQDLQPGVYTVKLSSAQGQWIESLIKR